MQRVSATGSTRRGFDPPSRPGRTGTNGERHVKSWWMACVAALGVALAGCGASASCKEACDKLQTCNLNSSGFSCDQNCMSPDNTCAQCLNGSNCSDITGGKCNSSCTEATFTPNKLLPHGTG